MKTTTISSPEGQLTFHVNDADEFQVEVDLQIPIPEGNVQFKGYLNAEEVAFNIKHSLLHMAMNGQLPFQVVTSEDVAKHGPNNTEVN